MSFGNINKTEGFVSTIGLIVELIKRFFKKIWDVLVYVIDHS